ncbi:DUF3710 domain-containing protein [Kribbella sp. NPDC026611]|uniref:DUF3710 domain-containing protein n=1 Tax=Kribbella sp. NPDC026611 TaxID=3154911 RepID=UPI0033CC5B0A
MIFRRKGKNEDPETDIPVEDESTDPRANGPYDSTEVEADVLEADDRIDLGALRITGQPGMELRLQVDEQTGQVQAILLVLEDSALELRAFAAPKSSGIWDEVREEIAAEASKMGGTATEAEGAFGTELVLVVPVQDPNGQIFSQTSRVIGVDGPRWMLRATVLGRAAVEPDAAPPMEETLRSVIVVRGTEPMAVRESLPLTLPPDAQPVEPEEA